MILVPPFHCETERRKLATAFLINYTLSLSIDRGIEICFLLTLLTGAMQKPLLLIRQQYFGL